MKRYICSGVLVLFGLASIGRCAASGITETSDSRPTISTKRLDPSKATDAFCKDVEDYLANRKAVISMLMKLLIDSPPGDTLLNSVIIEALGEMRAVEAAPLLATIIDTYVSDGSGVGYSITTDNTFGCVPALVKIGKPAAAACLEAIALLPASVREERRHLERLPGLVLLRVEGKDVARLLLEQRKGETLNAEQTANLDRVISWLDEVSGVRTAYPRPRIKKFPLTPKQAIAVKMLPEPTVETGMPPLVHMLIGAALGVMGFGLVLAAKRKLKVQKRKE